jgi:putative transcriptional regulator
MKDKKKLQLAIGKRIKTLREERNIPQQDLAAKCNIEKSNLSRLESGGTNPTIYTLQKIADNLNVTLIDIVSFEVKVKK